jgi:hypothetical protein
MKTQPKPETIAIFVDDGGPDADEFVTNYIVFNPTDPIERLRAWEEADRLWTLRNAQLGGKHGLPRPELMLRFPADQAPLDEPRPTVPFA